MNKKPVFVMSLIGAILGMVGSLFWMFMGTFFIGGMVDYDQPLDAPLTDRALQIGLTVAGIQTVIAITLFVIGLVKAIRANNFVQLKNTGTWLLVSGIILLFVNIFHLIPSILFIIAGSNAISQSSRYAAQEIQEPYETESI
ncbi:hypothetical protein J2T56_001696 [Natronobacillus azotifigens]|uniref:DUF4064 domain-containing protein n=1 Tax=Natronobacillus azotifigens TaxID=472978 RepID=A0A9J6RDK3_9BACI|nr:hypothetical protein [Natronobacillus azotifigens]MCZ0703427.1 hypothetical protein [Natronobacillus azotifigens]